MNRPTIVPILLVCTFALLAPPRALADFTDLEVLDRADLTVCRDPSNPEIPFKLDVCEIYAVFDDPADRVISVAFTNVSTTDPAGFYQHSLNFTNTAPACALIALEPTVVCDSFVTLGVDCADFTDNTTIDPDFSSFKFNSTGEVIGGWFNSAPSNGQGDPDANGRVLLARFSYKQNKTTTGAVCLFTQSSGSRDIVEFLLEPFDCSAPGGGLAASGPPPPATFFVDTVNCTPGNPPDGSEGNPFCTIQEGINETGVPPISGQIVQVAPGTYFETIDFLNRQIIVRSSDGAAVTTINAQQNGRVVTCSDGQGLETVLDGFTITGGEVSFDPLGGAGMLIVATSPTIINCTFTGNRTIGSGTPGAGMYLSASNAEVTNCTFIANISGGGAGGMCNNFGSNPIVTGCLFENNSAQNGGGMGNRNVSNATIIDCEFIGNTAVGVFDSGGGGIYNNGSSPTVTNCRFEMNSADLGGGMANKDGSDATVTDCEFIDNFTRFPTSFGFGGGIYNRASDPTVSSRFFNNSAKYGGGIFNWVSGSPVVKNSLFSGNTADDAGGGMYNDSGVTLKVINCTFDGNSVSGGAANSHGGGLSLSGPATVTNCTFSNNLADSQGTAPGHGGAVWISGTATVDNCVMWGDTAANAGDEIYVRNTGLLTIDFGDAEGGEAAVFVEVGGTLNWGDGNIGELPAHDPKFASAGSGNLHIKPGSPCIDAAINTAPGLVGITTDLDGLPRFVQDPDSTDCPHVPDPSACGDPPIADMGAYEFQLCPGASGSCPWDLFPEAGGDGEIGPGDLAVLLGNWGLNPGHPADFDCDAFVKAFDLANLLGKWGACP